jgi:heme-degrading monooxygenase HmoA
MQTATLLMSAAALAAALPAHAEEAPTAVVVIVRVPKPWYAPRSAVAAKMRDTVPQYARLPGLLFKAYSFERDRGDYGGVYYWRSRAEAEAWFNPAWFERVRKERGVEAQLRVLDAPLSIDNQPGGTAAAHDGPYVVTVVDVVVQAGMTRERLLALFKQSVPEHQQAPGLLRKHYTVAEGGAGFGGVYLWRDEAAARAWHNEAWLAKAQQRSGAPARITWFDTPILLPTQDAATTAPAGAMIVAAP